MDRRKSNKGKARITYDRDMLLRKKEQIVIERRILRQIAKKQPLTVEQIKRIQSIDNRISYINIVLNPVRLEIHRKYNLKKFRDYQARKRKKV